MGTIRYVLGVDAPLDRCFSIWAQPANLVRFFDFVELVEAVDDHTWSLCYAGKLRRRHSFHIRQTEQVDERVLAYRAIDGDYGVQCSISFDASGKMTYVTFVLSYDPPRGRLGDILSALSNYPEHRIRDGLLRFVALAESSQES